MSTSQPHDTDGAEIRPESDGPHAGQPVLTSGAPLPDATAVLILAHGRGAHASDMVGLGNALALPGVAVLAPQAADQAWYPERFIAPIARNQPWLNSALGTLDLAVQHAIDAGIPTNRIVLGGFSQGACLAAEYVARQAAARRRFGGLLAYSGGLIGPPGTPFHYSGSLDGTPVFLGCSDVDFHIPAERVRETATALRQLGGEVEMILYPGMGHTINEEEVEKGRAIVRGALAPDAADAS